MSSTYIATAITDASRFFPRLLITDYVNAATVSASTGTPEQVQSLTTYNRWIPTGADTITIDFGGTKAIDYVAAYLPSTNAATFALEWYNGSAWAAISTTITRTTPGCLLWLFESVNATKIRLTTSAASDVAVIKSGPATVLPVGIPVGYEPSLFNPEEGLTNTISVDGNILGTQIERKQIAETLTFDLLESSWVNSTWMPLRALIRSVGVFLAWNVKSFPEHVVYGAVIGDPQANYSQVNTMRLTMKMQGPRHDI